MSDKFQIGDRVQRLVDVHNQRSRLLHGSVIRRYTVTNQFGHYPEVYAVRWDPDSRDDDGRVDVGFLPHGLDPLVEEPDAVSARLTKPEGSQADGSA